MLTKNEKENLSRLYSSSDGTDIQIAIQITKGANLTVREIQEVADPFLSRYPHSDSQQAIDSAVSLAERYPKTFNNTMQKIANHNR